MSTLIKELILNRFSIHNLTASLNRFEAFTGQENELYKGITVKSSAKLYNNWRDIAGSDRDRVESEDIARSQWNVPRKRPIYSLK